MNNVNVVIRIQHNGPGLFPQKVYVNVVRLLTYILYVYALWEKSFSRDTKVSPCKLHSFHSLSSRHGMHCREHDYKRTFYLGDTKEEEELTS